MKELSIPIHQWDFIWQESHLLVSRFLTILHYLYLFGNKIFTFIFTPLA